jgi:D-sedoheptulose 7-phosphate isomerase
VNHAARFLAEVAELARALDGDAIEDVARELLQARERGGRVFVLGVGGSAANASHFVNDLRKLCDIEAYAPTDNVAELTARTNDDGWANSLSGFLQVSRLGARDLLFVLSVGGGDTARGISPNLVRALELGAEVGARIAGVVGRDGGYTARVAHACVVVPTLTPERVTPHVEAFQGVLMHLFVSHPRLQRLTAKWEGSP